MKVELISTLALELMTQAVKLMQRHNQAQASGQVEVPDEEVRGELDAAIEKLERIS